MSRGTERWHSWAMEHPALFSSILCGTDNSPSGIAACRQAAWLSHPEGSLQLLPTRVLTAHGHGALAGRCEGHDLLVLGSEPEAHALVEHAPIPVLCARWCAAGRDVTDRILVAVGDHYGVERAASLAAEIARRHRGAVSVVAAPGHSARLARAVAATSRIVLCTAGHTPEVVCELAPPEIAVPRAALENAASLLVLGVGDDAWDTRMVTDIARRTNCSVLTVPVPVPAPLKSVVATEPAAWPVPMRAAGRGATIGS